MEIINLYYVMACVFGFGFAAIAYYGIRNPDWYREKSLAPLIGLSVVLGALTLGTAIAGAIQEKNHEEEAKAEAGIEKAVDEEKAAEANDPNAAP